MGRRCCPSTCETSGDLRDSIQRPSKNGGSRMNYGKLHSSYSLTGSRPTSRSIRRSESMVPSKSVGNCQLATYRFPESSTSSVQLRMGSLPFRGVNTRTTSTKAPQLPNPLVSKPGLQPNLNRSNQQNLLIPSS